MSRSQWRFRGVLLCLALLFGLACNVSFNFDPSGGETAVDAGTDGLWYEIYFTDPACPPEGARSGGIDEILAEDLLQAQSRVDLAAFDLDAAPIVDALIELEGRNVPLRVLTDDQNEDLSSILRLRRNGISVVTDDRSALMHNKFTIIDGRILWTGSMNYTGNGAYCNNNNAVRFDVPALAANYEAEMDEMYEQGLFGPRSPNQTPSERLRIDGLLLENYFAPEERLAPIIADVVRAAEEEILFMAFAFTEETIGSAVLERAEAGVRVRGVFETTGSETSFSYYPTFRDAALSNLQVRQDGNSRLMHHKVFVVDQEVVIFGSFNFSNNANESNDENVLVVHDPQFAGFFVEEFTWVWQEAR